VSTSWQREAEELRRLAPRHVLFLCVANSARSQMAEGIARALAPATVEISSGGSEPTQLNPLAVKALAELGIDISGHRSKSVNDVPPDDVDAVITLCAEEVCPVFLGRARRVHWALADPAQAGANEVERLQAFRDVRDELRRRLARVFVQPDAASVELAPLPPSASGTLRALLGRFHLPADDVGQPNQTFVAAYASGELVGCVGLERFGADALLRSLAVVPRMQGAGLGKKLYLRALAEARSGGVRSLYLLTTTAARFFERAGFERIDRGLVPPAVAASAEFDSLCPASAVCMRLRIA
jgi:arsenate reductase